MKINNKVWQQIRILCLENSFKIKITLFIYTIMTLITSIVYLCLDSADKSHAIGNLVLTFVFTINLISLPICFDGFTSGSRLYSTLMLPATSTQKMLARFILLMIIMPCIMFGIYFVFQSLFVSLAAVHDEGWAEVIRQNGLMIEGFIGQSEQILTVYAALSILVGAYLVFGAATMALSGVIVVLFLENHISCEVLAVVIALAWIINFVLIRRVKPRRSAVKLK